VLVSYTNSGIIAQFIVLKGFTRLLMVLRLFLFFYFAFGLISLKLMVTFIFFERID